MRMPGHMGNDRITTKNLEIMEVDEANNIISIKGAVPGARNGLILIQGKGDLKIKDDSSVVPEKPEEKLEEKVEVKEEVKNEETKETKIEAEKQPVVEEKKD
jgi:hypothetical protein